MLYSIAGTSIPKEIIKFQPSETIYYHEINNIHKDLYRMN